MTNFPRTSVMVLMLLLSGCRYEPRKPAPMQDVQQPQDAFVIEGENGKTSGTVKVEHAEGVPRLTVDMRGDQL